MSFYKIKKLKIYFLSSLLLTSCTTFYPRNRLLEASQYSYTSGCLQTVKNKSWSKVQETECEAQASRYREFLEDAIP